MCCRLKTTKIFQLWSDLRRARSLQGLHVTRQLQKQHVRANPKVHAEYHRLRQEAMSVSSIFTTSDIHVCLLNIRSLRKNVVDIMYDANLTMCDVLTLTETQLLPHHSDGTITEILHPYSLHRQDHPTDKYSSLAICAKYQINILQKQYISNINGLKFIVSNPRTNQKKYISFSI